MSFVMVAAAAPGLITGVSKLISGSKQKKQGEKLLNSTVRPTYTRPGESIEALNLAERSYLNGMPGSSMYENRIGRNVASATDTLMRTAGSSGDILDGITGINANSNEAFNNLALQEQQAKQIASQRYIDQLGVQSGYADKEFSYNQDQPYQNAMATASAMIGAGNQNKFAGWNDIAGMGASVLGAAMPSMAGIKATSPVESSMSAVAAPKSVSPTFNPATIGTMVIDPSTMKYRYQ